MIIMKNNVLFLLSMLAATSVWAQDTVQSPLMENYYMEQTPSFNGNWGLIEVGIWGDECGVAAKEMTAKEPLKIYGVAACMVTKADEAAYRAGGLWETEQEWWNHFWSRYSDTTTEECYEYLGIYLRDTTALVPHREVIVHKRYDTPAYYVESGKQLGYISNFVYPMYEKYFDSAISVTGDFYVGVTQRSCQSTLGVQVLDHMPFYLLALRGVGIKEYHVSKYCYPEEGELFWWWPVRDDRETESYLLFPILTPDPDNPGNDPGEEPGEEPGDTTGVTAADLVSRYVTVRPNPATEEARVLSSFGIEGVEVFDAEGRRVAELRGEGLEARIDVRGWAAGSYLLRVATPLGATTKKLLVR